MQVQTAGAVLAGPLHRVAAAIGGQSFRAPVGPTGKTSGKTDGGESCEDHHVQQQAIGRALQGDQVPHCGLVDGWNRRAQTEAPYTGPVKAVQKSVSGYAARRRGWRSAGPSTAMAVSPGGLSSNEEEGAEPRLAGELSVSEEEAVPLSRRAMENKR